jgi:gliding motility-associated-like protein
LTPNATLVGTTGTGYYNYTAAVGFSVSSVQVTPVTADATATVTVNGSGVTSGSLSQAISVNVGVNTITTVVTAQDDTAKTVIITVNRAGAAVASLSNLTISTGTLAPAFATATLSYTATVPYPTASVNLTPTTTDPNATVMVNGSAATSGVGSAVALSVGLNKIVTVVTAQNGTTTSTYTTYITRTAPSTNALYTSIALSPVSTLISTTGPGYLNYKSNVAYGESSVQVISTAKDPTATITVNGLSVASGSPSQAIALNVGANTVTTVITAQDGVTTKSAIITVTRAAAPLNNLYDPISVTKPTDNVTLEDGIVVHQAVSPNGDGINDYLTIDGITSYPDNRLMILDRNGAMVYQTKGYDNSSKIFDGHSNINGKMQLPGTYFIHWIIQLPMAGISIKQGLLC